MTFYQWFSNGKEFNFCIDIEGAKSALGPTYYGWKYMITKTGETIFRFSDDFVDSKYWVKKGAYHPVDFDTTIEFKRQMIGDLLSL